MQVRGAGLVLGLGLVAGSLAAAGGEAEACSCSPLSVRPRHGEEGVPRNVEIVLLGDDWLEGRVFEVRRAGDDVPVEVEFVLTTGAYDNVSHVLRGRPVEPLEPATSYELVGYRAGTDAPEPDLTTYSEFTTGTEIDEVAPEEGTTRLEVQRRRRVDSCGSSCWSGGRGGIDLFMIEHRPLAPDAALARIELGPEGEEPRTILERVWAASSPDLLIVTSNHCDDPAMPELEEGRSYCARVQLFDRAGNAAAPSELLCAPAVSCAIDDCDSGEIDVPPACLPLPADAGPDAGPVGSDGGSGSGCAAAGRGGPTAAAWLAVLVLLLGRRRSGHCRPA